MKSEYLLSPFPRLLPVGVYNPFLLQISSLAWSSSALGWSKGGHSLLLLRVGPCSPQCSHHHPFPQQSHLLPPSRRTEHLSTLLEGTWGFHPALLLSSGIGKKKQCAVPEPCPISNENKPWILSLWSCCNYGIISVMKNDLEGVTETTKAKGLKLPQLKWLFPQEKATLAWVIKWQPSISGHWEEVVTTALLFSSDA